MKPKLKHQTYQAIHHEYRVKPMLNIIRDRCKTLKTYLIEGEVTGLVKIGRCVDVQDRLKQLQAYSPDKLRVLLVIPANLERELHLCFASERQHGEWFKKSPAMCEFVQRKQSEGYGPKSPAVRPPTN